MGYPAAGSAATGMAAVANAGANGKGLFFILSRTTDFKKLRSLEAFLPFIIPAQPGEEMQAFFSVSDARQTNPILRVSTAADVWTKLPPVFVSDVPISAKPESEVLASAKILSTTTDEPLFLSRRVNRNKSLALLCYGVWRWKSYAEGVPGAERILENLFSNSVRWLVTRDDEKPVQVRPSKEYFAGSEPVEFTAQVYDENYRPIDEAEVSLSVSRKGQSNQLTLSSLGNGRLEGAYDPLPEGDYTYSARVVANGRQIAEEHGLFSVGGMNVEFQETRGNKLLLQQIAARTGGKYYEPSDLHRLPEEIVSRSNFRPRDVSVAQQFELWNKSWMLAAIVALFAIEWFFRKRYGMI
jgi:hypothetical protein